MSLAPTHRSRDGYTANEIEAIRAKRKAEKDVGSPLRTLHTIGKKIRNGQTVHYAELEIVAESDQVNWCAIVEVLFGADYVNNPALQCYEAPK